MIGQNNLKEQIMHQINSRAFPRFTILVGPAGGGKKLVCRFIADSLGALEYKCGTGVDDIRNMIVNANKINAPILYSITDADKMSLAAKNALLKVTEEPPNNAYFIVTLTDINNTLPTIRSRGSVILLDRYSSNELCEYGQMIKQYTLTKTELDIIRNICETPGEVNTLLLNHNKEYITEFYSYVEKVVDNISYVSGSNSFKIAEKVEIKSGENKYDLRLFWKAFMSVCANRLHDEPIEYSVMKYYAGIKVTSAYLQSLRTSGVNRQMTFDMWILDIRKEWIKLNV